MKKAAHVLVLFLILAVLTVCLVGCYATQKKAIKERDDLIVQKEGELAAVRAEKESTDQAVKVAALQGELAQFRKEKEELEDQLDEDREDDKSQVAGWLTLIVGIVLPIAGRRSS